MRLPSRDQPDIFSWLAAPNGAMGTAHRSQRETFITTGQSLSWIEHSVTDTEGNSQSFGEANIPLGAATCRMVAWYHA